MLDAEHYSVGFGRIVGVYPDAWECDVADEVGGYIKRAVVLTHRLPEASSAERPQWCVWGFARASVGLPWCIPIPSRLVAHRGVWRILEIAQNWRVSLSSEGVYEITTLDGALRLRLVEDATYGEIKAGSVLVQLDGQAETLRGTGPAEVTLSADGSTLTLKRPGNARAESAVDAEIVAPEIRLTAAARVVITAPQIQLVGVVEVV